MNIGSEFSLTWARLSPDYKHTVYKKNSVLAHPDMSHVNTGAL